MEEKNIEFILTKNIFIDHALLMKAYQELARTLPIRYVIGRMVVVEVVFQQLGFISAILQRVYRPVII